MMTLFVREPWLYQVCQILISKWSARVIPNFTVWKTNLHKIGPMGQFSPLEVAMSISHVLVCVCHCGNPASQWHGDIWLKSVLLIMAYL